MPDRTIIVNIRRDPFDVYIGRAGKGHDGYFGNPHTMPGRCRSCGRDKQVLELLAGRKLHCLKLTKDGHPRHPLYVRGDTQPAVFREGP